MWSERKDGGQAFPRAGYYGGGQELKGMTLRDWFAGQALAGLCGLVKPDMGPPDEDALAGDAYTIADAMLAAREVRHD